MVTFSSLKKNTNDIERLNKEIEKANSGQNSSQEDNSYWRPSVDKAGNGFAVIRFLPAAPVDGDEGLPWVKLWTHSFQGPGGWYIENCRSTIGQPDPVMELNNRLWGETDDDDSPSRKQARTQKRKLNYIANIYVVSDAKNPEAQGKVFKYKFGKKIFEKIQAKLSPEIDESTGEPIDPPVNVFDFWKGANFRLKVKTVAGYPNYDDSSFANPAPLLEDDKALEAIWNSEYSLKEIIDPSKFKSYDELSAHLAKVLGEKPMTKREAEAENKPAKAVSKKKVEVEEDPLPDVEDDDLAAFKRLANDED